MTRRLLTTAILLIAGTCALADDCFDYAETMHWVARDRIVGGGEAIALDGDLAFMTIHGYPGNDDLQIFDISTPTAPVLVGGVPLEGYGDDVVVMGDLAILSCGRGGLQVVDVSDPGQPIPLGSVPTQHHTKDLAATAGLVLATESNGVLNVLDVGDPTAPVIVGAVAIESYPAELAAIDGYAYLLEDYPYVDALLHVIDLADPTQPEIVATVPLGDSADSLALANGLAYVVAGSSLLIFDVSNPAAPVLLSDSSVVGGNIAVHGTQVYVSHSWEGISVIDAADPAAPVVLGAVMISSNEVGMVGAAPYLFTANASSGLNVIDLSVPSTAPIIGEMDPAGYTYSLTMVDRLVFVGGYGRLRLVDAADPAAPVLVGEVPSPGFVGPVVVEDDLVYMVDDSTGVHVVDVSEPSEPAVVGHWVEKDRPMKIAMADAGVLATYLDEDTGKRSLKLADLTDPQAPVTIGSLTLPRGGYDLAVSGEHAFITCGGWPETGRLAVVDLSVPTVPVLVSDFEMPGVNASAILADGAVVYVAYSSQGIQVVDVSDPAAPIVIGSAVTPGAPRDLALVNGYLHVTLYEAGVVVFDVADPAAPRVVGAGLAEIDLRGLAGDEGLLVLSQWQHGLRFMYPQCGSGVPVIPDDGPVDDAVPAATRLVSVHPNPFNPRTTVHFAVSRAQRVSVTVFDLAGRRIAGLVDRVLPAGDHAVAWDGRTDDGHGLPSGAYLVRLRTEERVDSRKVLLVR